MSQVGCHQLGASGGRDVGAVSNMPYLHRSNPLATPWGIAGRSRRGDPEPTTGRMSRSTFGSISDSKGWPRGMDLCANGLLWCRLAQDQLGCSAALAQMQRGLHWHAHGSHVPQGTQGTSTVVHSWCTHTLYSNLVGMATDTWADTPWSNSWGVLYPSRVTTPFLSYSFYELVDSVSWHVLYSSLCGCAGLGRFSRDVVVTRFGVKLKTKTDEFIKNVKFV